MPANRLYRLVCACIGFSSLLSTCILFIFLVLTVMGGKCVYCYFWSGVATRSLGLPLQEAGFFQLGVSTLSSIAVIVV